MFEIFIGKVLKVRLRWIECRFFAICEFKEVYTRGDDLKSLQNHLEEQTVSKLLEFNF